MAEIEISAAGDREFDVRIRDGGGETQHQVTVPDRIGDSIDPDEHGLERVVREFGPRLHHVHAKDLEIDREGLFERGIMSAGIGWQVPRLPGLGEVRWDRFLAALYRVGYDGCVVIEHEDRDFEGSDELVKAGFLLARNTVGPYVV